MCECVCVCVELLTLQTVSGETLTFFTAIADIGHVWMYQLMVFGVANTIGGLPLCKGI